MSSEEFQVPDFFDPDDWENPLEEKEYVQKPIGEWILLQIELGNMVVPKIAEVIPVGGKDHSVMWVERILQENSTCSRCFQVVCDCVMDLAPEEVDRANFNCRALDKFIKWGAAETRRQRDLDNLFNLYQNIPSGLPVKEDRNERPGDKVLETLIKELLEETTYNPEDWIGNRLSGTHNVTGISYIFSQERKQTLRVIEEMESEEVIDLEAGEVIRLRAA
jgi:hypothetical protein